MSKCCCPARYDKGITTHYGFPPPKYSTKRCVCKFGEFMAPHPWKKTKSFVGQGNILRHCSVPFHTSQFGKEIFWPRNRYYCWKTRHTHVIWLQVTFCMLPKLKIFAKQSHFKSYEDIQSDVQWSNIPSNLFHKSNFPLEDSASKHFLYIYFNYWLLAWTFNILVLVCLFFAYVSAVEVGIGFAFSWKMEGIINRGLVDCDVV
jgi:hypothetical protein